MTNSEVDAKVIEITTIEAQIKMLKELVEKGKQELKDECDARKVDVLDTGANRVWYVVTKKRGLDTTKAKEYLTNNANIDDFMKESYETRFSIKHILTR